MSGIGKTVGHIPYTLYCDDIENITKFYFGQKNQEGKSVFTDVTEDREPIFRALSLPMQSLS